jgi:tetratricopeptide (TPR) repeat protein
MGQAATPTCPILIFMTHIPSASSFVLSILITATPIMAQAPQRAPAADSTAAIKQSLSLAERGKCKEALQLLKKTAPGGSKELRLKAGVATVSCAINREQTEAAVEAIQMLNRDFPRDPQVLYVTTHAYSDLSTQASLELARTAPESYQAHEMNAEALEMRGKWDAAAREYEMILKQFPSVPGIHYRMARLYLSKPDADASAGEKARKELQMELQLEPRNPGAEYLLGELARTAGQWNEAIDHLSRATKLDPSFADAYLRLGMSCISAGKFPDAIPSLETYVKMQPTNPAGHYHLGLAYGRVGRSEDAKREAELQRATAEKVEQEKLGRPPAPSNP